jgi:CheY-like chemotaxis protein
MVEEAMPLTGRTILLVEDQQAPRDAMVLQLVSVGATAVPLSSAEALDLFLAAVVAEGGLAPDLLLLDLNLPKRGGLETLRGLRKQERWKTLPVVIISADDDASSIDAGLAAGCQGFLCKPVRAVQLIATCLRVFR